MSLWLIALAAAAGGFLGDSGSYLLGRTVGAKACLSNALRLETYIQDAEREGDSELADFFRRAQAESRKGAEQASSCCVRVSVAESWIGQGGRPSATPWHGRT